MTQTGSLPANPDSAKTSLKRSVGGFTDPVRERAYHAGDGGIGEDRDGELARRVDEPRVPVIGEDRLATDLT